MQNKQHLYIHQNFSLKSLWQSKMNQIQSQIISQNQKGREIKVENVTSIIAVLNDRIAWSKITRKEDLTKQISTASNITYEKSAKEILSTIEETSARPELRRIRRQTSIRLRQTIEPPLRDRKETHNEGKDMQVLTQTKETLRCWSCRNVKNSDAWLAKYFGTELPLNKQFQTEIDRSSFILWLQEANSWLHRNTW